MSNITPSNYWLDIAVRELLTTYPTGAIIVSSGISPSASYHIGHFREIMTADALTWGIKAAGRSAHHVHIVDNFDPLRKRYDFLPESYEKYVGWPISLVPDPFDQCRDQHITYAEHFYREFEGYAHQMGIVPDQVIRSYEDLYANGRMSKNIETAVARVSEVRAIFAEVSNRNLPEDWLPLQLLSKNNRFNDYRFESIQHDRHVIIAIDSDGNHHELDYTAGSVKLNWRVDWPGRWNVLGVQVEPFSAQEHGAAGGSYETGERISREIFGYEPPVPGVRYANIHMLGDTKKMSSSKGNLITPSQALAIMPPEVLRYFVVRSRADRTLVWDSGQGLFNLLKEFVTTREIVDAGGAAEFADAYRFAIATGDSATISSIPFEHLVQVYQTAGRDLAQSLTILRRTGYDVQVTEQEETIVREFTFVSGWLEHHAPESIIFCVQKTLPKLVLSPAQITFVERLAETIEDLEPLNGESMHTAIYDAVTQAGIKPGEGFKTLYRLILARDSGPRAGWFLASLEFDWLRARLRRER
jgi:lysyl-tRNA synthetase class 1